MKKFLKTLSEEWVDYAMLIAMAVLFALVAGARNNTLHDQPSTQTPTNCAPVDPK